MKNIEQYNSRDNTLYAYYLEELRAANNVIFTEQVRLKMKARLKMKIEGLRAARAMCTHYAGHGTSRKVFKDAILKLCCT